MTSYTERIGTVHKDDNEILQRTLTGSVVMAVNDTDIQRFRYQFSHARVTIVTTRNALCNRLWRHQENVNRTNEIRRRCVAIVYFITIDVFIMSYKIKSCLWCLWWRTVYALRGGLFWCLFINTKITISYAHKQSMHYSLCHDGNLPLGYNVSHCWHR